MVTKFEKDQIYFFGLVEKFPKKVLIVETLGRMSWYARVIFRSRGEKKEIEKKEKRTNKRK